MKASAALPWLRAGTGWRSKEERRTEDWDLRTANRSKKWQLLRRLPSRIFFFLDLVANALKHRVNSRPVLWFNEQAEAFQLFFLES